MPVSERDREYFRRIGEFKAESHAEATREHLKLSLDERLARSWALYLAHKDEAQVVRRDDDPSPFYERARALGMYRP
jgi:hypothetical protein